MQAVRTLGEFVAEEQIITWLSEQMTQNYRDSERGAKAVAKQARLPMVCSTCTATKACCNSYVIVRFYEGLVIAETLVRTGRDTPELREDLRKRADLMDATPVHDWFTPCVFLDGEQRCSVYAVRPTTCAQLLVYSSPDLCNARSSQVISYTPRQEVAAANELEEAFRHRLSLRKKVGRRYMGVLPRMVLVALEAWDRTDFRDYLRQLEWPTEEAWVAAVSRTP